MKEALRGPDGYRLYTHITSLRSQRRNADNDAMKALQSGFA